MVGERTDGMIKKLKTKHLIFKKYIMRASIRRTATESRVNSFFSSLKDTKRVRWAGYRNFNR
jgi:hypothetical protein